MSEQATQEYDDDLMALLEAIWGEGFMSPGGVDEVDRYLDGIDLHDRSVLDIGCGLGGIDVHLVRRHGAAQGSPGPSRTLYFQENGGLPISSRRMDAGGMW